MHDDDDIVVKEEDNREKFQPHNDAHSAANLQSLFRTNIDSVTKEAKG